MVAILEAILITTEEVCVLYKYIIEMVVPHNLTKVLLLSEIEVKIRLCIEAAILDFSKCSRVLQWHHADSEQVAMSPRYGEKKLCGPYF